MIAMAAVNATLDVIARDGLLANAKNIEAWIRDACSHCKAVKAVHGKGCLLGVEFEDRAHPHYQKLLDAKILTGMSSDPSVLRLLPPLNVSEDEIKLFAEVLSA